MSPKRYLQEPVLVTRASHQSQPLVSGITRLGAQAITLPTIDIHIRTERLTTAEEKKVADSDLWIFTSANAVTGAQRTGLWKTSYKAKIATIGQATAEALKIHGIDADFVPEQNTDSEGLLSLLSFQNTAAATITIIRGGAGRRKLKTDLSAQGAKVNTVDVYERRLPQATRGQVDKIVRVFPCTISITSNQGLLNLLKIIPKQHHHALFACDLIVNSDRCAKLASQTGFRRQIIVAEPPGDRGQLAALQRGLRPSNL